MNQHSLVTMNKITRINNQLRIWCPTTLEPSCLISITNIKLGDYMEVATPLYRSVGKT
jgi:hypothetical protein